MTEVTYEEMAKKKRTVKVPDDVAKVRDERIAQHICLGCLEQFPSDARFFAGQCRCCYQATTKAIREERYSSNELIRSGQWLPGIRGRRPKSAYSKWVNQRWSERS